MTSRVKLQIEQEASQAATFAELTSFATRKLGRGMIFIQCTFLITDSSQSWQCLFHIRFPLCATPFPRAWAIPDICLFFSPLSFNLLRIWKYCKYCRVAPDVAAVEGIFLWNNHPDCKGSASVRKGLGHWTILRAVETPVPSSKSIHLSIHHQ